jgi:hypothetical protein
VWTEKKVGGIAIPEAVPVEGIVPEVTVAPEATEEVCDDTLPELRMDVVIWSLEIQDAESIRSAPMSETATASRDGLELLADDLINLATVAHNLESMRRAEQWMKVRDSNLVYTIST